MTNNYIENLLQKPSLFIDESKLDMNYVPDKLPHREKELSLLCQLFLTLITNPNSISRNILITGKIGVGKTATVKLFGEMLTKTAKKRDVSIKCVHINCRKERTSYKVLIKIVRFLNKNFPKRGYSPQDLIEIIIDFLNSQNLHLLIVLDELSYLINKGGDLIYSLTRINDDSVNAPQRLSIIGIVREILCLNDLDSSTLSTLQKNIIKFNDYSLEQIFDILKYRVEISLKKDVISDEIIELISEIVMKNGDIRYGLNLLWRACKIAESKNLKFVAADCVRLGNQELIPFSTQDVLKYMTTQKLLFLLAIIKTLNKNKETQTSIIEALKLYRVICEAVVLKPRSHSQLWNYIQEYKRENLISIKITSEKNGGRKTSIAIYEIPLSKFEKNITDILNLKGVNL